MTIYFYPVYFCISLALLALILIVLYLRRSSPYHILFSAIFGVYIIGAISVAVFPFVISNDTSDFRISLNLIPFNFGNCFDYQPKNCMKDIFNNILLTIPFGMGIHVVARIKPKDSIWLTFLIGCSFEFAQLIIAVVFHAGFRAIDINDIILNTIGAFIGYLFFRIFGWLYLFIMQKLNLQPKYIFAYIQNIITPHFDQ